MVRTTFPGNAGASYVAPAVDVIEVAVEKGFATTGSIDDVPMHGACNEPYADDSNFQV